MITAWLLRRVVVHLSTAEATARLLKKVDIMAKKQATKADHGSKGQPTTCLMLWHIANKNLPATLQGGWGTLHITNILQLRMRIEGVAKLLVRLASELGYRFAPLQWREVPPEAGPWDWLDWATQDRQRWLDDIQRFLSTAIFERGELPLGWEGEYPLCPLDSREVFSQWLSEVIASIRRFPGCVLSAQTDFRDVHRWLSAHNIADRPEWPATPNDVNEIERQLAGLSRWLDDADISNEMAPIAKPQLVKTTVELQTEAPVPVEILDRLAVLFGDSGGKMMLAINDKEMSTDQKLRAMERIDKPLMASIKSSEKFGSVLGVTGQAIRNTDWWKGRQNQSQE